MANSDAGGSWMSTVSVEPVWEPARGVWDLLTLEAMGTRHTHAQTYMQAKHPYTQNHNKDQ